MAKKAKSRRLPNFQTVRHVKACGSPDMRQSEIYKIDISRGVLTSKTTHKPQLRMISFSAGLHVASN